MSDYRWFEIDGRQVFRRVLPSIGARSDLSAPTILKDTIAPVRSMADGRVYDSMSALRRSYRADGNPQGQEYIEVGDAPLKGPPPVKHPTKAELNDLLHKVEAMHSRGEVPAAQSVSDPL